MTRILLAIEPNQGYTPDQVPTTLTIHDLISNLEAAAATYGEDALVILDNGNRYGAQFGGIDIYRDLITPAEDEEEY